MGHTKIKTSYPLGATLKRMLKNAADQDPKLFLLCIFYTMAAAVYPFLAVLLPKLILGELEKGARPYSRISLLRLDYLRLTAVKVMEMAYPHTEDAAFMQKYDKAFIATQSNDNGVEGIYHKLYEIPAVFVAAAALSVFVGRLSLWVLLGLCLNLAAMVWISRKSHRLRYEKKEEEAGWSR